MIKRTITYEDYNGIERTEDFYFNLTQAELTELELSKDGGLKERLEKLVQEKRVPEIMEQFKAIILVSYGKKSDDGRRFIKNKEVLDEFTQTEAFSKLYMELAFDADKAATFVNGITASIKGPVNPIPPATH